ncbi:MAG: hypothetical protein LBC86_04595, partial [Oscillospiraceae bacterium]|nr:hypothetical protein [Oscillospiraceae bacterium]
MKKIKLLLIATLTLAFLISCADNQNELTSFEPPTAPIELPDGDDAAQNPASIQITFDYEKQSGWASNQFAVWLEDTDGNFIRT